MIIQRWRTDRSESWANGREHGCLYPRRTPEQQLLRSAEVRGTASAPRDPAGVLCVAVPGTLLCAKRCHRTRRPLEFPRGQPRLPWGVIGADATPAPLRGPPANASQSHVVTHFPSSSERRCPLLHLALCCRMNFAFLSLTLDYHDLTIS